LDEWSFGQQVTALYEIVPLGGPVTWQNGPSDRFLREAQQFVASRGAIGPQAIARVSVRYRLPAAGWQQTGAELTGAGNDWRSASPEWRLAAAAAGYGLLLKAQVGAEAITFSRVRELAEDAL